MSRSPSDCANDGFSGSLPPPLPLLLPMEIRRARRAKPESDSVDDVESDGAESKKLFRFFFFSPGGLVLGSAHATYRAVR
jgi:hypothetical protein